MSKKIWHISSNRWNSAITEYAISCARSLQKLGHPTFFSPLSGSPAAQRCEEYGLDVYPVDDFGAMGMFELQALCRKLRPDVIIVYGGQETFLTKFLSKNTKLIRFRGYEVPGAGFLKSLQHRLAHSHVDLILTPSQILETKVKALDHKLDTCFVMLGVDEQKFSYAKKPRSDLGRPELLVFGRFDPVKGHQNFLKIYAKFLQQWEGESRPLLKYVGNPENVSVSMIEQWVTAQGLSLTEDVLVHGQRVADAESWMRQASLGVVPSLGSEIICRVAQEFLLCGTAVFVSKAGSLGETIAHEEDGSIFSTEDTDGAAKALLRQFRRVCDESDDVRYKRSARAQESLSLEAMGKALETFLN